MRILERKPILEIRNLCYSYEEGKLALNNVSLSLHRGEKVAVIGNNGAVKSTFFLNMNGVYRPQSGELYFKGEKITKKNQRLLNQHVGIVFQDADSQIIASTVLSEISFGPMNLKLSKEEVEERVNEAISFMKLEEYRNRLSHYLSGGEKKRVSIADIIAMHSDVIIFDEPTASLDPANAKVFEDVIEKLAMEGKTLLISTHDMDFAYRWADRVIVFSGGEIIADGSPVEIFRRNDVIERANLKKPMLLEVYEMLIKSDRIHGGLEAYPRDLKGLREMVCKIELSSTRKPC